MSKAKFIITIFVIGLLAAASGFLAVKYLANKNSVLKEAKNVIKDIYYCPMHPSYTSDKPGDCPICGMALVKKDSDQQTSAAAGTGVYISQEKQQLIGVKKEAISKRHLTQEIRSVGRIAYDPDLYVAQEEYLQALKTVYSTDESSMSLVKEQIQGLLNAAEQRLLLLGMNKSQIEDLVREGRPQENLYFPQNSDTVWVYISVYEYEMGRIKEGLPVEADALAFPGEVFRGNVAAITPVLDSQTRSAQVRAEIENTNHKLKPEMFVNAKIEVDLGEQLAVPETAVLDTGLRKIVYLVKEGDILEPREVKLGQKAQGYYELISGLSEGDIVVTSGNFLIDSESKLNSAVQGAGHKHE